MPNETLLNPTTSNDTTPTPTNIRADKATGKKAAKIARGFAKAAKSTVTKQDPTAPKDYQDVIKLSNRDEVNGWLDAMTKEYNSLIDNNTWELVKRPPNRKVLRGRWVLKNKIIPGVEDFLKKARFVAKGYKQIPSMDYTDTYAAVSKTHTFKILMAIVASRDWEMFSLDVTTAFLYGFIDEEIYVEQPEGFSVKGKENYVCKLKRSLYGLKQAPRNWYRHIRSSLEKLGFRQSDYDQCLFINYELNVYILMYVDDFIVAGPKEAMPALNWVKGELK